ncbi:MAG: glycosyltransferase family 39 protein [Planctomycetes bacterium]|nr:glycosyltransferase family 39 protein [Planctomycetota bacterium]
MVGVVTAVAAGLRLFDLGAWSFWVDEAHTWRDATMRLTGDYGFLATDRRFYPVAPMLLRFLIGVGVTGFDEGSLRLPFALVGILTVPLMASCGRRLIGAWPAVLAAGLLAIHPWHVFWSQNARFYVLAVAAAVWFVERVCAWQDSRRLLHLGQAGAALLVGTMSHPPTATLAVGLLVFLVARRRPGGASVARTAIWSTALLALLLVGVPWLVDEYAPFEEFLEAKGGGASLRHFVETSAYYFRPTQLLFAAVGAGLAMRSHERQRGLLLTAMAAVPFLVLAAVSASIVKVTARYSICTLPAVTWLVAFTCARVFETVRRRSLTERLAPFGRVAVAAALPLMVVGELVQLDVLYYTTQHGQRPRWAEAVAFVEQEAQRRGQQGLHVMTISQPTMLYYLRRRHWFVTDGDPHPNVEVHTIQDYMIRDGTDELGKEKGKQLHEPGLDGYFDFHRRIAARRKQLLAVMVKRPELMEKDPGGLWERLHSELELALYLPCWVGPKDESVYVFLMRE